MAHAPKHPDNPCSLVENEQIPAKIWELLRRNKEFAKVVENLRRLDLTTPQTNGGGPEKKKSCSLIDDLKKLHPLAAHALQWLVPEPEFFIRCKRHGRIQEGWGNSPDMQDSSWGWRNYYADGTRKPAVRVGGVPFVRGPVLAAAKLTNPFPDWRNWRPGEALFNLKTPWRRLPRSFRRLFVNQWRNHYDSPDAREFNFVRQPSHAGRLSRDDLAEYLTFRDTISRNRLFAVSPAMLTTKDVRQVFARLAQQVNNCLPPNRKHLFGTEQAWRHYIALKERGLSMSEHILGSDATRQPSAEDSPKIRDHRKNVNAGVEAITKLISLVFPAFDLKRAVLVHSAPPRRQRRKP